MNTRDDTEELLRRFSAEWPDGNSIVERVMQEIESTPVRVHLHSGLWRLMTTQRIAAAGVALSTVVGLLALLLVFSNSVGQLSAMERMAKQLREVESFSYKLSQTMTSKPEAVHHPLIIQRNDSTIWRAPGPSQADMLGSLYAATKIVHIKGDPPDKKNAQMTGHIEEIHPVGKPGILIDHMTKTYWRVPPVRADEMAGDDGSPVRMLQIVREEPGEILRELGTKEIGGTQARGFLVAFKAYAPFRTLDSVEVWIDPETDLPLEFGYEAENKWKKEVFRVTDCRWNIDLDPQLFEAKAPDGYTDTTPPKSEEAIGQITQALRLYSNLSGGHYPRVTQFDVNAIKQEMLQMAGFEGEPQNDWTQDPKFQQVQQAADGLDWISRLARNQFNAGYYGDSVNSKDKDQVLLWWTVESDRSYRVFFGDLSTELLTGDWWQQLHDREVVRETTREVPATDVK